MNVYGNITGVLTAGGTLKGTLTNPGTITGTLTVPKYVTPPAYGGPYEITPNTETQTLETNELYLLDNITINPIPNNYGLITWNGSTITVS